MEHAPHLLLIGGLVLVVGRAAPSTDPGKGAPATLTVTSSAFASGAAIPTLHACPALGGEDVSPPLDFASVPAEAGFLALVMDDPDAPGGSFTHWTFWDLPRASARLPEDANLAALGASEGTTGFESIGYGGPCPPPQENHRYFFKAYATRDRLGLDSGASASELTAALQGKVLARGELVGTFRGES